MNNLIEILKVLSKYIFSETVYNTLVFVFETLKELFL